jgi:hypothetical protein|uniref:Fiber protein Fb15 n=4 Tax=Populus TaxID=3689 RepID=B9IN74_POPTR
MILQTHQINRTRIFPSLPTPHPLASLYTFLSAHQREPDPQIKKNRFRVSSIPLDQMALRKLYSEIKGLKVKELPDHVKPMLSIGYVKKAVQRGMDNYHAKYIETSSIDPLLHVCYGGMILSYLIALPEERRHLEHQQHAKEHGGH